MLCLYVQFVSELFISSAKLLISSYNNECCRHSIFIVIIIFKSSFWLSCKSAALSQQILQLSFFRLVWWLIMSEKRWKIHRSAQWQNFSILISSLSHCEDCIKLLKKSITLIIFTLNFSFESWAVLHIHSYLEQSSSQDITSVWNSVRNSASSSNLHTYWVECMSEYHQLLDNISMCDSLLNE